MNKILRLIEELNERGLRYCHWKSNRSLANSLSGDTDVDFLVHRADASLFRYILCQMDFRPAINQDGEKFPSMEHYFALDEESGVLVHVHAYFRVITGESLSKNYRFPIEEMLLQNTRQEGLVRVPTKSAELIVFTLRLMLKHTSLIELILLSRYWPQVKQEIKWLLPTDTLDEALKLLNYWLPAIDTNLFSQCVTALNSPDPLYRRMILGYQLRGRLRIYSRHSAIRAWLTGMEKFIKMSFRRLIHPQRGLTPLSGGAVIAFVGPEATGKSTLIHEIGKWLGEHFAVEKIHVGKPKSTLLSSVPNLLLPILRFILSSYRTNRIGTAYTCSEQSERSPSKFPLIFAIRAVLLAYDRRALLTQAFRRAANGKIILCDRYPSSCVGAADSPQLSRLPVNRERYPLHYLLAQAEKRLYQEIPPPDMVFVLSVPVEVAIIRNKTRGKFEPEDYLRIRHTQSTSLEFERTAVFKISTDHPLEITVLEIKKAIWNIL